MYHKLFVSLCAGLVFAFGSLAQAQEGYDDDPVPNEQSRMHVDIDREIVVETPGKDFDNGTSGPSTDHDFSGWDPSTVHEDDTSVDYAPSN